MLHALDELMSHRLRVGERKVPVQEVFFHLGDRKIRYLAVDIGGWFDVTEVIVSADLLVLPEPGRDHWSLALDAAALESAPRWGEHATPEYADLTSWPPIVVGPFGGTYAPILLYEQMMARREAQNAPADETAEGDAIVWRLERATEWIGRPAFGRDGELGTVEDMLFDEATRELQWLILGSGGLLRHRLGEVPLTAVRHMTRQGTHLVLDVSKDEVGSWAG